MAGSLATVVPGKLLLAGATQNGALTLSAAAKAAAGALLAGAPRMAPAGAARAAATSTITFPQPLALAAGSLSRAAAPVSTGTVVTHSPYTFDSIVIFDSASQVAEIARSFGPLEAGSLDAVGNWVPAGDPAQVIVDGFGVSASGVPYYDTHGVDLGDEAQLFIDPLNTRLWLSR